MMSTQRLRIGDTYWLEAKGSIWYVHWYEPVGRQTRRASLKLTSFQEAVSKVRSWVDAGLHGDPRYHPSVQLGTVKDLLEWDWAVYGHALASAGTHRAASKLLVAFMGATALAAVPVGFEKRFAAALRSSGHTLGYAQRCLAVLRAAGTRAAKGKLLRHAIMVENVEAEADREAALGKAREMTPKEIAGWLDAVNDPHVLFALVVQINTLSRPDAVFDLDRRQVEVGAGLLKLNPDGRRQTKKYRPVVRITDTLAPWLSDLPPGPVIRYRGKKVSCIKTAVRSAAKRAGLDGAVSQYSIRISGSRFLRRSGVPPEEIAIQLGHVPISSKKVTLRYAPYDPTYLSKAKEGLEAWAREIAKHCKRREILAPPWAPERDGA